MSGTVPDSGTDSDDGELVDRARGGDPGAFEQLYRRYAGRINGLCLRMTGKPDIAEECTQDAFVQAWRNLGRFEGRSAFATWLHRIAVNEVLARSRRRGPVLEAIETTPEAQLPVATDDVESDAVVTFDIESAIASLPAGARHVLVLQAIYGFSHEETAEMLGIAVGTCKAQLHRARGLLKSRMTPGELEP